MARLTPGRYAARALYHSTPKNSNGNTELRLTVLPYATSEFPLPPNYKPTPITIYMTITAGTMGTPDKPGWVLLTLKHLGFNCADLESLDPESEVPHSFTGREVIILGTEDEYKGKNRTRWNILRNVDESKPTARSELRALSERFKPVLMTLVPHDTEDPFPETEPQPVEAPKPPPGQLLPPDPISPYDRSQQEIKRSQR